MKNVNKYVVTLFMCLCAIIVNAQNSTDKLKKEQERLEEKIANTKSLLDKTQNTAVTTLNELKLIDNQVKSREALLRNFDNQIRSAELKIQQKNQQIETLEAKLLSLTEQYKKLIIYAYKRRSKEGRIMYIVSSHNYYEALKRKKYLEKIAEIQSKQKLVIQQHKKLIQREKQGLIVEKTHKVVIAGEKKKEKDQILTDRGKQEQVLNELKSEESRLMAHLREDEKRRIKIKNQIDAAIERELAAERAKAAKKVATKAETKTSTTAKTTTLLEPKEVALNEGFESNKGRLPWPVSKGAITEGYGKQAHPTIPNVFTQNNGVDISAARGAQIMAVFEGEVTSVFSIPGAGKVVIIKHGNYRSVYSNLEDTYVTAGTKVKTKQVIGSLLGHEGESLSVAHFEIHQVVGSDVNRINPSLWLVR